jgi:transposase
MEAGFMTDLWTLKRIRQVIRREFGVRYTITNVWKLMQSLGWSCQKPDKRARERNEAAVRDWQQQVWPRIKKNRTTWSPFSLP